MKRIYGMSLILSALVMSTSSAHAMEYFELEVYGYETASPGEKELENFTSVSSGGGEEEAVSAVRSSFEFNYGLTEKTEIAGYADFTKVSNAPMSFAGTRLRTRTRFFEKGEKSLDLGAYAELSFPRGGDTQIEGELRGIIEKDLGRWTVTVNPILEKGLKSKGEAESELEFNYATSVSYRVNPVLRPHLDLFGELESGAILLSSALDLRLGHGVIASALFATGLTEAAESRLGGLRVEYEF